MKRNLLKSGITICLSVIISLVFFTIECFAVTPTYTVSDSYKSGKYYTNLLGTSLTGDQAVDIVNVAKSQLGYHQGKSKSDMAGNGTATSKEGKYNEYGYMHGNANDDWCAYFVSWCARQARIPTSIISKTGSCKVMRNNVGTYYDVTSGYVPKKGDLILFEPSGSVAKRDSTTGRPTVSSHVAIITQDCSDGKIRIIEGNNLQRVYQRTFTYTTKLGNSSKIQGYLHPNYTGLSSTNNVGDTITDITSSIKVYSEKADNISSNNAVIYGSCEKPSSAVKIESCGVYFGTSTSNMKKSDPETVSLAANNKDSGTGFEIWYDIQKDLEQTLSPGTTYYYQFYCNYNGKEIKSSPASFKTLAAAKWTTQRVLIQVKSDYKTPYYYSSTANEVKGYFSNSSGGTYYNIYAKQFVDLPNGKRRFLYEGSPYNGNNIYVEYNPTYMTAYFYPTSLSVPESHIYLNTETNTTYTFDVDCVPVNSYDSINEVTGSYDYNVISVGNLPGHTFSITAKGVGTTTVTFESGEGLKVSVTVTVVDGGPPVFDSIEATDKGDGKYQIKAELLEKDLKRIGVATWLNCEEQENAEITWYDASNSSANYGEVSYGSPYGDLFVWYTADTAKKSNAGGFYTSAIYAEDAYGNLSSGEISYFVNPSAIVPNVTSVKSTVNDITVKWNSITNMDGYNVYRKTSGSDWSLIGTTTSTSYTDKSAKAGVNYYYNVRAYVDNNGKKVETAFSKSSATKTAKMRILAAPATVKSVLYGYDDVKVSWSKVSGAKGYAVYYRKSSADKYKFIKYTTSLSLKKANLTDGAKYYFKVVPYSLSGDEKVLSKEYKTTNIYTLKKISTPTVTKSSSKKIKVKWKNISGETGYQISKSTSKKGTSIVSTYKTTSGKSKTLTVKRRKTYYYKVRAYKVVDGKKIYGPWSSVKKYKLK